jgi:short-subunit dehydrogenase
VSWALIAGGSKGIGFSIAKALAKRKYNVLLIARNYEDLINAKINLQNKFKIQVEVLSCDLSLSGSSKIIFDWCSHKNFEIKILCNAAGMGGSKDFPELPLDDLRTMIRLNLESVMALCFTFIPLLKQTSRSFILNIGSMAGFAPIPIKSVYASTKSSIISFSYSLKYLLKENNISVSCVCPGPVFTKPSIEMETIKQLGWPGKMMAVESDKAGECAVQGMLKGKMIIIPGKLAKLISYLLRIIPHRFTAHIFYAYRK